MGKHERELFNESAPNNSKRSGKGWHPYICLGIIVESHEKNTVDVDLAEVDVRRRARKDGCNALGERDVRIHARRG